jgi:hypothetical protein
MDVARIVGDDSALDHDLAEILAHTKTVAHPAGESPGRGGRCRLFT